MTGHARPRVLASKRATRRLLVALDHGPDEECPYCQPPRPRSAMPDVVMGRRERWRSGWVTVAMAAAVAAVMAAVSAVIVAVVT